MPVKKKMPKTVGQGSSLFPARPSPRLLHHSCAQRARGPGQVPVAKARATDAALLQARGAPSAAALFVARAPPPPKPLDLCARIREHKNVNTHVGE